MKRLIRWGGILLLTGLACSGLERNNPLDPENPETGGRVTGVTAQSRKHDVRLEWDEISSAAVSRYNIYRREENDADFIKIGESPGSSAFFEDPGRPYDRSVQYRLSAVTTSGYESPISETVSITPGPVSYWVLDYYDGSIHHITYDGRHRLSLIREAIWPTAAAADTLTRRIWVIDYITGFLLELSEEGDILEWISGLDHPTAMALDPLSHELWIVNRKRSEIVRLDSTGRQLDVYTAFSDIRQLVWSGIEGSVWVADHGRKEAGRLSRDGTWIARRTLVRGKSPAVGCQFETGLAWIADSTALVVLSPFSALSSPVLEVTLPEPAEVISVNQKTGSAWLILGEDDRTEKVVIRVDLNGVLTEPIPGFQRAHALAANPHHGGCLVADRDHSRIVMLDSSGAVLSELSGFISPWYVINY